MLVKNSSAACCVSSGEVCVICETEGVSEKCLNHTSQGKLLFTVSNKDTARWLIFPVDMNYLDFFISKTEGQPTGETI